MATDRPTITTRPASPTFEEGGLFAHYLDTAAEGFFGFMLGRRSADILARAFIEPGHDLSHQNVTFAVRDGVVVGMASGYTGEQHRSSSKGALERAAGALRIRYRVVSTLLAPMMRTIETVADGDFYIQAVAVDEAARGAGVGSTLLELAEERARAAGATRLALVVAGSNHGARRLYERRGWTVDIQWPGRLVPRRLSFFRMTKAL